MIAIRGAITIQNDSPDEVYYASKELILKIINENHINICDIVSIITTCTDDIKSAYPGPGIRNAGVDVPILSMQEQFVQNSLKKCIRFIVHINQDKFYKHIYLNGARVLRPDYEEE